MGSDLNITKHLQDYILKNGLKLHPIQKEIIDYNLSLGDIKRMQMSHQHLQSITIISFSYVNETTVEFRSLHQEESMLLNLDRGI